MGLLWLSTVPLTNGTIATMFGVRHLSMLAGIVFLFHQVGSFLGGWLGGLAYDQTGSYSLVWQLSIILSVMAALLNLPIRERLVSFVSPAKKHLTGESLWLKKISAYCCCSYLLGRTTDCGMVGLV